MSRVGIGKPFQWCKVTCACEDVFQAPYHLETLHYVRRRPKCAFDQCIRGAPFPAQAEGDDGPHPYLGERVFQRMHKLLPIVPITQRRRRLPAARAARKPDSEELEAPGTILAATCRHAS
jgi:hypothetical protein